jgi:hypothetical protein
MLKSQFWLKFSNSNLHEGQRKVLNRLLDSGENDFEHGISTLNIKKPLKLARQQLPAIYLSC